MLNSQTNGVGWLRGTPFEDLVHRCDLGVSVRVCPVEAWYAHAEVSIRAQHWRVEEGNPHEPTILTVSRHCNVDVLPEGHAKVSWFEFSTGGGSEALWGVGTRSHSKNCDSVK